MRHADEVLGNLILIGLQDWFCRLEVCADELVVGGGVGWSYDRRRRRAAHFSSAAAAWLNGRRRQTGRESTETAHSLDRRFFLVFTGVSHFTCDLC